MKIRVVDGWCPIHGSLQAVSPFEPWVGERSEVVDNYHCDVCMKQDRVYTPILIATEPYDGEWTGAETPQPES